MTQSFCCRCKVCKVHILIIRKRRSDVNDIKKWLYTLLCKIILERYIAEYKEQGRGKIWKSGGGGGDRKSCDGHNLSPLVEIGLIDLTKSGGAMAPSAPTGLKEGGVNMIALPLSCLRSSGQCMFCARDNYVHLAGLALWPLTAAKHTYTYIYSILYTR